MPEIRSGNVVRLRVSPLGQLDRIVAGILDTIDPGNDHAPGVAASPLRTDADRPEQAGEPMILFDAAPDGRPGGREPAEAGGGEAASAPSGDVGHREGAQPGNGVEPFLTEEEEAFVARAVDWLASRPDPDILLERIWTLLVDRMAAHGAEAAGSPDMAEPPPADAASET